MLINGSRRCDLYYVSFQLIKSYSVEHESNPYGTQVHIPSRQTQCALYRPNHRFELVLSLPSQACPNQNWISCSGWTHRIINFAILGMSQTFVLSVVLKVCGCFKDSCSCGHLDVSSCSALDLEYRHWRPWFLNLYEFISKIWGHAELLTSSDHVSDDSFLFDHMHISQHNIVEQSCDCIILVPHGNTVPKCCMQTPNSMPYIQHCCIVALLHFPY